MMLRSSSTPVLGSLLQSISESPNNNQSELHKHAPNSVHAKISRSSNGGGGGAQDFRKSLFHPSPSVPEIKGSGGGGGGFRRAQSDGNLEGLIDASSHSSVVDEFNIPKRSARRNSLETINSFSANNLWTSFEDDEDDYEGIDDEEDDKEDEGIGGGFRMEYGYNPMRAGYEKVGIRVADGNGNGNGNGGLGKMYLASGIGASGVDFAGRGGGGGGGGGSYRPVDFSKDGGDSGGVGMEEHYKRMLESNPGNPLYLRNYAEFLYKIKGDYGGAEEYYARAILADQEDGESLSQYGKIIWELHGDKERAANYFERAIAAASHSSHVHAAYANFLWEAEEDEDEENAAGTGGGRGSQRFLHQGLMASATA